ncbi:tRNA 4-thiouridine(8) synthase ThiI [Candidatus Bathyarchaeota archaeon]|nr:tRNA 4-thiouridine(8) synthase ThiI [Candidatus Bathyarchaeota archaeon]
MTILASYSEIALKGRYVRSRLEKQLAAQIEHTLKKEGYSPLVTRKFGRIYVDGVPGEAAELVARVFGVVHAMPATRTEADLESVAEAVVQEAKSVIKDDEGFAVRPKVVGNHSYGSRDVAIEAGSRVLEALLDRGVHVNLDEPDVTLYVEVRDMDAFVYSRIIPGVMGLPYGSQGRVVSLFSGGIDSPVSTWLMMKRGLDVMPLFMDQRPYVGEGYVERARESFRAVASYVPVDGYRLYSAPFGDVMARIMESPQPRYTCILCKRSMYRVAERFAVRNKAKGIVTGESLGQVASQTMDNLYVLSGSVDIPVLRPTIGLDKVEIEAMARNIGTYSITAKKVDGCTAVPGNPATRSTLEVIEGLERELCLEGLIREAADAVTILDIAE